MTGLDAVLVLIGLGCLAVLLVIGVAALVQDMRAERADRRRLTAIVDQVQRQMQEELGEEWTPRRT